MATDLLGISVSGLRANQTALSTTGHNIANAGTDGYSRQRVTVVTNPSNQTGAGYIGNGVSVSDISRVANDYVNSQVRTDTNLASDVSAYYNKAGNLDNLLSNSASGLSSSLETFFSAMQNGSTDPTSIPARQLIVSEAQNTADRFNTIYARMDSINGELNASMHVDVAQVNALSNGIAQLNLKITDAMSSANAAKPNDLLDQRDEALRKLSELVAIQTFDEGAGKLNVILGSGQSLVIGNIAQTLELQPNPSDVTQLRLVLGRENGQKMPVTVSGGDLGGLIRFRDESLYPAFNKLGRVAVVMADAFNTQHKQGVTLNNAFGTDLFNNVNDPTTARNRVLGNSDNTPPTNQVMSLFIQDSQKLTTNDYEVSIEGGGLFRIKRVSDDQEVTSGLLPGTFPFKSSFDGLELNFEAGEYHDGDKFTLRPVHNAPREFSRIILNGEDVAFGSPLSTDSSIGNVGTGKISAGQVTSLLDKDGKPLPLLQTAGEMKPPLVVHFTSPTSYEILDNSDPGNPRHLDPPLRNLTYVPGVNNQLFPAEPHATMVTSDGDMIGLPEGRRPVQQAALLPGGAAPNFGVQDFSAATNQFSFDVTVDETLNGANDGTFTVRINQPAIGDTTTLLQSINSQLSSSGVRAFIADDGSLAFHLQNPGYGNITLNNYNPDPDAGGNAAPLGQANNLLGFNIEGASFTTTNNTNGVAGFGALTNGYPAELLSLVKASSDPGGSPDRFNVATPLNASAKTLAATLNNVPGVSANASTYANITGLSLTKVEPLQISLNGETLLPYTFDTQQGKFLLDRSVPDPTTSPNEFNDFLAGRINNNETLKNQGIYASAARDAVSGRPELRVYAQQGDDLAFTLEAAAGDSIAINDGKNPDLTLVGQGTGVTNAVAVGGRLDVTLGKGLSLASFPDNSLIFGDTRRPNLARNNFLGIQAAINGSPKSGDNFTLDFNHSAASDNRNALGLVDLQHKKTMDGGISSFNDSYGSLVETVGIQTNASKINSEAAKQVLTQTTQLRNSISGVNMDEEAADLVKYQQMYSANARVIQVARDLFDTLLKSFG